MSTFDVVIAGAGVIGLCVAFQLARRSSFKILVIEKGAGVGEGSTGASSAVCRFRYSRPETIRLARDGIGAYQQWSEFLGDSKPAAAFRRLGVLWLGGEHFDAFGEAKRLQAHDVRAETLDNRAIADLFPSLNPCVSELDMSGDTEHVCGGTALHLFEPDGGYMEPVDVAQDLVRAVRRLGVDVRFNRQVIAIQTRSNAVTGVTLSDGEHVSCGTIVNAAGAWCGSIYKMAQLDCPWPLVPTRIQIVQIERSPALTDPMPVCADLVGGVYFRTQKGGQEIIVGSVRESDEQEAVADPDRFLGVGDDVFISEKLFQLQHRLPSLDVRGRVRSYCGLYTTNRSDFHPIVGETPLKGLYAANGCSGHGFKLAPAIGSLLAQALSGQAGNFDTDVPPEFLGWNRRPIAASVKGALA